MRAVFKPRFFAWLVCLFAASQFIAGCGGHKPFVWPESAEQMVWPAPPEIARLRYLHSFAGPDDLRDESSKGPSMLRWLLGKTEIDLPLSTPYAVASDAGGIVWIADNGSSMLYRYDLPRRKVDYFLEAGGIVFRSPVGIAINNTLRQLLVSDSELGKILVLDFEGRLQGQLAPPEGFGRPGGLALDSRGRLYVADVVRRQVFVFNPDGSVAERRGSRLSPDGRFGRPVAVAVGPQDELLVLDAGAFLLEIQNSHGELLRKVGKLGDVPGTFARPRGVAVSKQGLVMVSDAAFDNVQIFDLAGQLLMSFGTPGQGVGQFNLPAGLWLDDEGRVFVADTYNHRVQVFQLMTAGGG